MNTNLGAVDKIDSVARMKTHLVNLALITKFCVKCDYKVGSENTRSLKELLTLLLEMKVSGIDSDIISTYLKDDLQR
jgi:hypothetical protein